MDDLISRQAAIDALDEYIEEYSYDLDEDGYHNPKWCAMQEAKMTIQRLPSAEPERKTGRWVPVTNGRGGHECDKCHEYAPSWTTGEEHLTNYCPNCGARMEV